MTLHEAMIIAIKKLGGGKQKMQVVADYINSNGLYTRKDGKPVPSEQISARVHQYEHLFSRKDGFVWMNNE